MRSAVVLRTMPTSQNRDMGHPGEERMDFEVENGLSGIGELISSGSFDCAVCKVRKLLRSG